MEDTPQLIVKIGFDILKKSKDYTQATVVRKLKSLGFQTSGAAFSNILNDHAGAIALKENAAGIQKLLALECSLEWDEKARKFIKIKEGKTAVVPEWSEEMAYQQQGFKFHHKGRLSTLEKTQFFSTAKEEMIEFGLTLDTFTSYFFSRNEEEFKKPIYDLLRRGVLIKCYLLDPRCNAANLYFDDRKKYYPKESEGVIKIRRALANFKMITQELDEQHGFPGKLEVFTYTRYPHQYALAIDPNSPDGKLQVSQYLYGELRARCPVVECTRLGNASLFLRYRDTLERLTKDATLITDFDQFLL
ncbi:MAG: hypothetical protein R2825_28110 [Saprospiraceae bacterium]